MRVGFFRRVTAFLLDSMPILMILSLLLSLFVGDLLKSSDSDYDQRAIVYQENVDDYRNTLDAYKVSYEDGNHTTEEYEAMALSLQETFRVDNEYFINIMFAYYLNVSLYFLISFTLINYFYHLYFKGQTIGRKIMKIELFGEINWLNLLIREVLWKTVYWVFTFSIGIAIDVTLIILTNKKKTVRDYLSQTELRHSGTSYPF